MAINAFSTGDVEYLNINFKMYASPFCDFFLYKSVEILYNTEHKKGHMQGCWRNPAVSDRSPEQLP